MQTTPGFDVVELFKLFKMLWRLKNAIKRPNPGNGSKAESEQIKPSPPTGLHEYGEQCFATYPVKLNF